MNNNEKFNELEQAILKTLAFFDIFSYPLTLVEIHKWLYLPNFQNTYQLSDIYNVLNQDNSSQRVNQKNGFYFLPGRNGIIDTRLGRYQIAEAKFRIARRTVYFLRWLKFLQLVAICNNTGYNNAGVESDIDFFIIVKASRLWFSRFLITSLTSILGLRRHKQKVTDRVCLSFYITDDHLNLHDISLKPQDPYLVYWFATLAPIYDLNQSTDFFKANDWLKNIIPNFYQPRLISRRAVADSFFVALFKNISKKISLDFLFNLLEKLFKNIQLKKMKRNITSVANDPDTRVIINDDILKFHETDRREEYRAQWEQRLEKLNLA